MRRSPRKRELILSIRVAVLVGLVPGSRTIRKKTAQVVLVRGFKTFSTGSARTVRRTAGGCGLASLPKLESNTADGSARTQTAIYRKVCGLSALPHGFGLRDRHGNDKSVLPDVSELRQRNPDRK